MCGQAEHHLADADPPGPATGGGRVVAHIDGHLSVKILNIYPNNLLGEGDFFYSVKKKIEYSANKFVIDSLYEKGQFIIY